MVRATGSEKWPVYLYTTSTRGEEENNMFMRQLVKEATCRLYYYYYQVRHCFFKKI